MAYFNILGIKSEGEVNSPMVMGQHAVNFAVSKIGLEKFGDDVHYIVEVDYEHSANGKLLIKLRVITKWLIVKLFKDEKQNAKFLVRTLLFRSVSHFNGVLS